MERVKVVMLSENDACRGTEQDGKITKIPQRIVPISKLVSICNIKLQYVTHTPPKVCISFTVKKQESYLRGCTRRDV